nr:DUF1360 domain-containing protein [Shouchella xiaoxiensis]
MIFERYIRHSPTSYICKRGGGGILTLFHWFLLVLAAGRLTRLIVTDDIMEWLRKPFLEWREEDDILYAYPKGKGLQKFIGELLSCYWCAGIWVAAFLLTGFLLWPVLFVPFVVFLSIAYGASIIESILRRG